MDENSLDNIKGTLTRDEQKWLHNWFDVIDKNQTKESRLLERINTSLTILVILAVLGVVAQIILTIIK
jgi:hypothetical protein